jgi:hypothetical protein
VATPNDFGLAGARPTDPELLDWLASEFIRQGWSIKRLHRLIVMSATYRQASSDERAEPSGFGSGTARLGESAGREGAGNSGNLLFRQNLRRLSAEQLRDSLLFVSGQLYAKPGGAPVWPGLPPEVLQANPAFLDDNELKVKGWYPSAPAEQNARSVYQIQKRTVRVPFMETFDLPENSTSCPARRESTVAPQALSLLNSPLATEAARRFAQRVERESGGDLRGQINRAFHLALQREPDESERAVCLELMRTHGLKAVCRALLNVNEFAYLD